jgi:hypothetical protein
MNYYILPKIKNNTLSIKIKNEPHDKSILSPSVHYFFNLITKQIENDCNLLQSIQYINPYIFLCDIDNNHDMSYYHLIELIDTFSFSSNKNNLQIGYYHFDHQTVKNVVLNYINKKCGSVFLKKIEMDLDTENDDNIDGSDDLILYDYLFFNISSSSSSSSSSHINNNENVLLILELLYNIITRQEKGGDLILKVNETYSKPITELLYILSILYEDKIIICKPLSSDITSNERFILCKNFKPFCALLLNTDNTVSSRMNVGGIENERKSNITSSIYELYKTINELKMKINIHTHHTENGFIHSILNTNIPLFYINKLEESNVIIGHYHLDSLYTFINHIKNIQPNKSLQDKIDFTIKNNIQKCVRFCEKYKIEHQFLITSTINKNEINSIC